MKLSMASKSSMNLSMKFGFEVSEKRCDHKAEKVLENKKIKILWDMKDQTDKVLETLTSLFLRKIAYANWLVYFGRLTHELSRKKQKWWLSKIVIELIINCLKKARLLDTGTATIIRKRSVGYLRLCDTFWYLTSTSY